MAWCKDVSTPWPKSRGHVSTPWPWCKEASHVVVLLLGGLLGGLLGHKGRLGVSPGVLERVMSLCEMRAAVPMSPKM